MKDDKTIIEEFNDVVNMTAAELEKWLKSSDSRSAGWPKDEGGGESIGHESGRKIIEILESNPTKESDKYSVEQIQHMRKVVSYCKRHLAQEERVNDSKSTEEVKKTKSYASLKNWGHDPLKKRKSTQEPSDAEDNNAKSPDKKQSPTKRKAQTGASEDQNKRRETKKGATTSGQKKAKSGSTTSSATSSAHSRSDESSPDPGKEDRSTKAGTSDTSKSKGESGKAPEVGEKVSWNWGRGQPEGEVLDVTKHKKTITTQKGNKVSRKGDTEDPAITIDTGKSTVIKLAHELND